MTPGLVCRGYQYEEGKTYKKNGHGVCVGGVTHYCVNPFDVLDYYPLVREDGKFSDFTTVEAIDEPVTDDGRKFATSTIKIGVKLGFAGFIKACIDFVYEKTIKNMPSDKVDTGDSAQIDISGNDSVGAAVGIGSVIKGAVGNWITLAEWVYDNDKQRCIPVCVKSAQIDGEIIKADTWYKLSGGEFIEVGDE